MCTANVGLGMSAAGIGLQAYGAQKQVTAANQAAEYNARISLQNKGIMEENARIQEARAADALARGNLDELQFRQNLSRAQGKARASMGASGASVRSKSFNDFEMDTVTFAEQDAMMIQHNARMEAWGYAMEARNARMQAGVYNTQAAMQRASKSSAFLPVAATVLTGATDLGRSYGLFSSGPARSSGSTASTGRVS